MMQVAYRATRRVQWRDTDAAGIAHFSIFFRYMEEVEHEFLRSLGLSVHERGEIEQTSWPRVSVRCDYQSSVRFEDLLEIAVVVERIGEKSVTYAHHFTCAGRDVARGAITAVCCKLVPGKSPRSMAIPADVVLKLKNATADE
jgi:4-hydroxybenzoyl-CoA thioesterase/acyl-CoA thioester hydrolase